MREEGSQDVIPQGVYDGICIAVPIVLMGLIIFLPVAALMICRLAGRLAAADPLRRRRTSLDDSLQVSIQTDLLDDLQRLIAGQSSILAQRFEDPDDR